MQQDFPVEVEFDTGRVVAQEVEACETVVVAAICSVVRGHDGTLELGIVGRTTVIGRGRPAELFRFRREVLGEKLTVGLSRPTLRSD